VSVEVLVEVPDDQMTKENLDDASRVLFQMDNWNEYFRHIAVEYMRDEYGTHIDGIGELGTNYDAEVIDTWSVVTDEDYKSD